MIAILSDIHGNLEALDAVFEDINNKNFDIDCWILLGDYVDYGADSKNVLRRLYDLKQHSDVISVRGNHDDALLVGDCSAFRTDHGRQNFSITCNDIKDLDSQSILKELSNDFINDVSLRLNAVHGSLQNPLWGDYGKVGSTDIGFKSYTRDFNITLGGHTHIQGWKWVNDRRLYINPGSVGQPRNGDPRAQYATCNKAFSRFTFHRVEYDIDRAARKILDSGRPSFLATRLYLGI